MKYLDKHTGKETDLLLKTLTQVHNMYIYIALIIAEKILVIKLEKSDKYAIFNTIFNEFNYNNYKFIEDQTKL